MFEIFFGLIWTAFTAFFTLIMYGTNGDVTVNGNLVSHEEFSTMLGPKLFIGIFWAVGIFVLYSGIRKVVRNSKTNSRGEECFGRIDSIYPSGTYINNRPELKADVLVYIPSLGETTIVSEIVGVGRPKYAPNSYVRLKYYEGDINFINEVDESFVPEPIKFAIPKTQSYTETAEDTIVVNGVEYVRKDSLYRR